MKSTHQNTFYPNHVLFTMIFWQSMFITQTSIFTALGHMILLQMGMIRQIYVVCFIGCLISFCHALLRPVPIEISRKRVKKVVSSDGFIDDSEEIVEFISSPKSNPTVIGKSPSSKCIKRVRIQELTIPLAVESK